MDAPLVYVFIVIDFPSEESPTKRSDRASFEAQKWIRWGVRIYSSMIPRFRAMVVAWVRSLAPNLERILLTRLFTDSSVVES